MQLELVVKVELKVPKCLHLWLRLRTMPQVQVRRCMACWQEPNNGQICCQLINVVTDEQKIYIVKIYKRTGRENTLC